MKTIFYFLALAVFVDAAMAGSDCEEIKPGVRTLLEACFSKQEAIVKKNILSKIDVSLNSFQEARVWTIERTNRLDLLVRNKPEVGGGSLHCVIAENNLVMVETKYGE